MRNGKMVSHPEVGCIVTGSNPVLTTLGCNSDEPTPSNKSQQQHTIVCRLEQMKGLLATIGVSGNEYRLG